MAEIAVFNPHGGKKKRSGGRRKGRSAAQKAATRKMIAANRSRRGKRRAPRKTRARKNPAGSIIVRRNARRSPARRSTHRRRARRNPSFGFGSFVNQTLMPSAVGAAGALGVDLALGFLPIPATIKSGPFRPIVRIAGAIAVGMAGGMMLGRKFGQQMTAGAVTVVVYDTLKSFLKPMLPQLALAEYENLGYYNPAVISYTDDDAPMLSSPEMGVYDESGVGVYDYAT